MRRAGKLALILVVGAVLSQLAFAAIWYESYGKAKKALDEKQWAEAVRLLNEAIALKSDSNARARTYGVNFDAYFPYLKLGVAYFNMGQFQAASQQLDKEEQLQEITKSAADYAQLKDIREKIKQALESQAAANRARIQGLVSASLEEAGRAEADGKWDEAIAAANKALALTSNDQAVKDFISRVQLKITQAAKQREDEARAAGPVREGEAFLADGKFQDAAAKFTEALAIQESARVRSLLGEAQTQLQASRTPQAPSIKEPVPVPVAPTATDRQNVARMLNEQAEKVARLLQEAEKLFNEKNYEAAVARADQVLVLSPNNQAAINLTSESLKAMNKALNERLRLPGTASDDPNPVIIPFGRQDFEIAQDQFVQKVREARYELAGSVYYKDWVNVLVTLEHYRSLQGYRSATKADRLSPKVQVTGPAVNTTIRKVTTDLTITYYAAPHVLRPGLSVFNVLASDPAPSSHGFQSTNYIVYYVPPFYRAGWFRWLLAVPLAALGAGLYVLKRRRRRLLSKRRFNPYVAGAPVLQDALFFGREALLKRVLQSVHNNSIMLYGERRIGKTSFQHYLKKRLARLDDPEYIFYPVFIDLQGVPQERFFSTLRDEIFRELAPVLDGALPTPDPADGSAYDYRELVEDIRKVLKILGARSAKKVKLVLQMDEVDQLNSYDPRVNQRLRSLFMRNFAENLAAVVSGVAIQKRWEGEGSPWYNFFEEIEIGPIRPEDAERLIEEPIRGKFKLEKGVTERVLSITGCRPYLVQKMCIALINRMHDEGRRTVTMEDVESVGRPAEA